MIPHFALSLSIDGIVLLHRVPDGWQRVGTVDVSSETLSADMAALLADAQALKGGDVKAKLILPDDQIRFLTIETALTSLEDVQTAVVAATPLSLDEVTIDFDRSGGRTHIAAVAKQTLLEAETFAREHGFEPVSFVAVAEPFTFSGEVFFGPTAYASEKLNIGDSLAREAQPPIETDAPVKQAIVDVVKEVEATAPIDDLAPDAAAPQEVPEENTPDLPVFASRNREASASPEVDTPIAKFNRSGTFDRPVKASAKTPKAPSKEHPPLRASRPTRPAPVQEPPKNRTTKGLMAGLLAKKPAKPAAPAPSATDAALARGVAQSHTVQGKPKYLGAILTVGLIALMGLVGMWANRQVDGGVAGLLEVDPGLQEDTTQAVVTPTPVATPDTAATPAPVTDTPVTATAAPETLASPSVNEDETPPPPIVTAVPGRVLSPADAARIYAATGVWQRAPRLPGEPGEADQSTLDGIHAFADLDKADRLTPFGGPTQVALTHELPILRPQNPIPFGREVARDENGFIRAAASGTVLPTGLRIYGRAPAQRPPARPTDETPALDDASLPNLIDGVVTEIQFVAYISESDLPPPRAFRAPDLSQPLRLLEPRNAETTGLAGAKFISAPPPLVPPDALSSADTVPDGSTDLTADAPTLAAAGTPANEDAAAIANELAEPAIDAPTVAAAGTPAVEDAPQEADAPAEPDVFVEVIQGRPAIVPPLRPGTPEVTAQAETDQPPAVETPLVQDPRLAGFRPNARPTGLAPASVRTFEAIPALAGVRPLPRPASLVPEVQDTPVVEDPAIANANDINAIVATIAAAAPPSQIINPTPRAIALSPRPDPRPTNFARVVASTQALQQRQQTRDTAASTASAVIRQQPSAPTSAPATGGQTSVTVSRAATVDSAIRLRDMNLIGVYGKPGARRALVRMPNGRFVKVEVGSSLDGGRVTAIGDSALNFVKRGQTYALQLPAG